MARSFDGSTELWAPVIPISGYPFTVAGWAIKNAIGTQHVLWSLDTNDLTFDISTQMDSTGHVSVFARAGGSSTTTTTSTTTVANRWFSWMLVCAAANDRRIFLNGGGKATSSVSKTYGSPTFMRLGATFNGQDWPGKMSRVAVWNAILSDGEAIIHALGTPTEMIRRESLVWYALADDLEVERNIIGGRTLTLGAGSWPTQWKPEAPIVRYGPRRPPLFRMIDVPSSSIVTGVLTAAGSGSAAFSGRSTAYTILSASGAGLASLVGAGINFTVFSSDGQAVASFQGLLRKSGVLNSSGLGQFSPLAVRVKPAALSAAGQGAFAGVGEAIGPFIESAILTILGQGQFFPSSQSTWRALFEIEGVGAFLVRGRWQGWAPEVLEIEEWTPEASASGGWTAETAPSGGWTPENPIVVE